MAALVVQSVGVLTCAEIQQHLQNRGRAVSTVEVMVIKLWTEICMSCLHDRLNSLLGLCFSNPTGDLGSESRLLNR